MKQSNFLSINWRDTLRSFLVAFLTFLAYWVQDSLLPSLGIPEELKVMISGGIGYLVKNLFTPADKSNKIIGDRPNDRK